MPALAGEIRAHSPVADRHRIAAAALLSLAALAVVTGVLHFLQPFVPVLSLGALYVLAVLPVAVVCGRGYAIAVSLASVLVFNFLFLPPRFKLTLAGGENWLILCVYLAAGLVASELAARARARAQEAEQREREAALLAELSTTLLAGALVVSELPRIARAAAGVLQVPSARIEFGGEVEARPGETVIELGTASRRVGALYTRGAEPSASARRRFVPALAALLAIALDREQLAREALEAEALRRSDALKTVLLRTVSHDLRSPLTAIRASLEALASADLTLDPADRESLIGSALTETQRLDRTVRNLLDLSRLQAGEMPPKRRLQTLEGILDQALLRVPSANGRIDVSLGPDLHLVRVDPIQIVHALVNLLENALKFSPPETRVELTVEDRGDEVAVTVADRGHGIPAAELERAFEPFRHASTASERRGAGLGLAIVKGFVEANGGHVLAEARSGGGTAFVLMLPAALDASEPDP